jgi:hypothetical protein
MIERQKFPRTHADRSAENLADNAVESGAWENWQLSNPNLDSQEEDHTNPKIVTKGHLSLIVSREDVPESQQAPRGSERIQIVK